jgi:hypothetical protein
MSFEKLNLSLVPLRCGHRIERAKVAAFARR